MSVCKEAEKIVMGDRNEDYGDPKEEFERVARLWSAITDSIIEAHHVPLCMIALKISREVHKHKRDNLVDICGYARTLELMENND